MDLSYVKQCSKTKSLLHNVDHDDSKVSNSGQIGSVGSCNKTCVLCKNADENVEHLFMQCHFSRRMWGRVLSLIEQQSNVPMTWEQFLQWCIQYGKGKSSTTQMFKIILTEGIYELWMERNSRFF